MKKKRIIQTLAVGLFAVLLAFNITTTINSTTDANVDVSLSGIAAMALEGGESASASCHSSCAHTCSISGYYKTFCSATYCDTCQCSAENEDGLEVAEFEEDCSE